MKTRRLLSFIAIIFLTLSCSESFFDRYPTDSLTEGAFYSTKQELEYGLNDAYSSLKSAYSNPYITIGEVTTDNTFNSKFNNNLDNINMNESTVVSTNANVESIWTGSYMVISRANLILTRMKNVTLDNAFSRRFEGESKFLRALMYFNLVRIFGSVPLVLTDMTTTEEAFSAGQEKIADIYLQIIKDLTDAKALLPAQYTDNKDIGRATSLAASTLLGKVYLTLHDYQNAFNILQPVIVSGVHRLLNNYFDVFDASKPNNAEIIFAVQYARGQSPSLGNPLQSNFFPNEPIGTATYLKSGSGTSLITTSLVRAFEKSDKRLVYVDSLRSVNNPTRYIYFSKKYIDLGQTTITDSGSDLMILRYSDVLLMCAEAKAGLNLPLEALPFITQVRTRAGLTTDGSIAATKTSIDIAIEKERRVEFNCEGHRWFDLLRNGRVQTVMNAYFAAGASFPAEETGWGSVPASTISDYELLFPIPQPQVILNPDKLKQNPGY